MSIKDTIRRLQTRLIKVYHISFDAADLQFVLPHVWWKEIGNAR